MTWVALPGRPRYPDAEAIRRVLVQAKVILMREGWTQNMGRDPRGRVCLQTAIITAGMETGVSPLTCKFADAWVGKTLEVLSIPNWNDTPGRTFGEVISALDKAILRLHDPMAQRFVESPVATEVGKELELVASA